MQWNSQAISHVRCLKSVVQPPDAADSLWKFYVVLSKHCILYSENKVHVIHRLHTIFQKLYVEASWINAKWMQICVLKTFIYSKTQKTNYQIETCLMRMFLGPENVWEKKHTNTSNIIWMQRQMKSTKSIRVCISHVMMQIISTSKAASRCGRLWQMTWLHVASITRTWFWSSTTSNELMMGARHGILSHTLSEPFRIETALVICCKTTQFLYMIIK